MTGASLRQQCHTTIRELEEPRFLRGLTRGSDATMEHITACHADIRETVVGGVFCEVCPEAL
jgi:hypothetical protein